MKNNKLWLRVLSLCLAVVCTFSIVAAATDLSGDGQTDVWDLQKAANENKDSTVLAEILEAALGGADELHVNGDGVYEIHSALGLYNMAKHATEDATFVLMNDIDLGGVDWTPISKFNGIFNGNGNTISNLKITKSVDQSMGFFASTKNDDDDSDRAEINNLNLVDVEIEVDANDTTTLYIGGIAGTNRGDLNNCTVLCSITDNRTTLPGPTYIGVQAGRNGNRKVTVDGETTTVTNGVITGTNSMDALEYYDFDPQEGTSTTTQYSAPAKVNSMMATHFAELSYPEGTADKEKYGRTFGIAGYSVAGGVPTDLVYQDITNSSYYDSQTLRDRRTTVAASMYEMSTVEWTPSQTMKYLRRTVADNRPASNPKKIYWAEGDSLNTNGGATVFRGIPYNHGSSSIYRFLAYMGKNADDRWQTVSSLPTVAGYYTSSDEKAALNAAYDTYHAEGTTEDEKAELLAQWPELAYMDDYVTGIQFGFNMYIGADCSSQALWAWRAVNATSGTGKVTSSSTSDMFICDGYIKNRGILPVNDFKLTLPDTDLDGDGLIDHADKSITVKNYTRANTDYYMETLSCVTKGDLLMDYTDEGGHTLVAMSDAVTIRNYKGVMDLNASYIVTAEQGGSGGTRTGTTTDGKTWTSSCCVDEVNSFTTLYGENPDKPNYPSCFFPITCAALQQENTPAATVTISMTDGVVTSNFQIVSSTVNGETVYAQILQSGHRAAFNSLTVAEAHPEVAAGDTVQVLLSNGETYTFTY